jgi:predicted membrane channel-forming protein YqfA (hemolysin III family)
MQCQFEEQLLTADKVGILFMMWGSNIPIVFYGFDSPFLQTFYLLLTVIAFKNPRYLLPLIAIQTIHMYDLRVFEILLSTFSYYLIAAVFYSQAWHPLWHVFTAIAGFVHYHNLRTLL